MRFPDALEDWWGDYERSLRRRGRSEQTVEAYRRSWARFWTWAIAHGIGADPRAVDTAAINRWVDALRERVAPSTVSIHWRNVRPFFTWWSREVDAINPFAKADTPGVPDTLTAVVPLDDIRKLLAVCSSKSFDDRRDMAIIHVLIDCGLRLGELVGVKVADWDRRADLLYVNGQTGLRVVPHSAATGEALARYIRARAAHPKAASEALWLGGKGGLRDSAIGQLLARRCRQAGLARIHPHQLRHTWAHEAKMDGLSEGDLMVLAGWKTRQWLSDTGRAQPVSGRATPTAVKRWVIGCDAHH